MPNSRGPDDLTSPPASPGGPRRVKRRRRRYRHVLNTGGTDLGRRSRAMNLAAWGVFALVLTVAGWFGYQEYKWHRQEEAQAPAPALSGTPEDAQQALAAGQEALDRNDAAAAAEHLARAAASAPDLPGLAFQQARAAFLLGRLDEAETFAQASIDRGEDMQRSHHLLGLVLVRAQRPEEALAQFAASSELSPWDADVLADWGAALRSTGKNPKAVEIYQRAVALQTDNAVLSFRWKMARIEAGEDDALAQETRDILAWEPANLESLVLSAALALRREDKAAARAALERASQTEDADRLKRFLNDPFFAPYVSDPGVGDLLKPYQDSSAGEEDAAPPPWQERLTEVPAGPVR